MEREIIDPIWENGDTKERIICKYKTTLPNGTVNILPAVIGNQSPEWNSIIESYGAEMDSMWNNHIIERKERQAKIAEGEKRTEERLKQEALFAKKLELFEIEQIKNSTNKKLKSSLRKAKNETEAMLYGMLIMKESLDNEQ